MTSPNMSNTPISDSELVVNYGMKVKVELIDSDDGSIDQCFVVLVNDCFDLTSNPGVPKITSDSPLGKAIYKKPVGYETSYSVADGRKSHVKIISIN